MLDAWYELLANPQIERRHMLTQPALSQKYELMEYGYDQSLLIRPEADDGPDQCKPASILPFVTDVIILTFAACCQIWLSSLLMTAAAIRSSSRRLQACCASGQSLGARTMLLRASPRCHTRSSENDRGGCGECAREWTRRDTFDSGDVTRWSLSPRARAGANVE